jgi:hypothetical protein
LNKGRKPLEAVDEAAIEQVGFAELDGLQPSQQLSEQVSQLRLGQLVARTEMRTAVTDLA